MALKRQQHPDPVLLERLALGELPPGERLRVERHLESCPECQWLADELAAEDEVLDGLLDPFDPAEYDLAIDRVFAKARGWLPALLQEVDDSAALLRELLREPVPRTRWERVLLEERFHSLKLCQLLTDRSQEAWFTAPTAALDLAGLAVGIARSLDASRYGRRLVEDARARAWAYLGNAYRILADLPRAEAALGQAWRHLELSGDLLVRGELLRFLGSFQNSQERFDEAIRFLDEAAEIYRELGDRSVETRILLSQGKNLGDAGRFEEAIRVLRRALSGIKQEEEPKLWVMLRHNLLLNLSDLGKHETALKVLQRSEWAYHEVGGSVLLRGRWAEATLSYRLGRLHAAESLLLEVRDAFADLGTMAEAAEISLERRRDASRSPADAPGEDALLSRVGRQHASSEAPVAGGQDRSGFRAAR